ncbi:MAG TPA: ABC transporter ATP-binding protein [Bryobacteraceae bacterium]|nr:ABC transporter ATP-binding protein [Bryobacteraceae bacterium]
MNCAVRFQHVTKTFAHHAGQMLLRDRLKQLISGSPASRFEALHDVSFELPAGESLGLIGSNGAGKSTILNLATGLAAPDSGTVDVNGHVAALLELGAGFHRDLTGAENVRINAALMGLSRRETEDRFEDIVEFSGVREFINEPLRTYSSGMTMRLAFSVAVASDPDILLADEILGVGDEAFYKKSLEKIREFQRAGKTILLASHSAELIRTFCDHALWLEHGRVMAVGEANEVIDAYRGSVVAR